MVCVRAQAVLRSKLVGHGVLSRGHQPGASSPPLMSPDTRVCVCAQVAVRSTQLGVVYFNATVDLAALLLEGGALEPAAFVPAWKALPDAAEAAESLPATLGAWPQASARLAAANVFTMAHKAVPGGPQPCSEALRGLLASAAALLCGLRDPERLAAGTPRGWPPVVIMCRVGLRRAHLA